MRAFIKDSTAIAKLTPEQYRVTQESGTERAGTGEYLHNKQPGIYVDIISGEPLFSSLDKFDSGTGWPSFWAAIDGAVGTQDDTKFFMTRTEVHCARCGGHLGHIFDDGPPPTGKRHCINGVALTFQPATA